MEGQGLDNHKSVTDKGASCWAGRRHTPHEGTWLKYVMRCLLVVLLHPPHMYIHLYACPLRAVCVCVCMCVCVCVCVCACVCVCVLWHGAYRYLSLTFQRVSPGARRSSGSRSATSHSSMEPCDKG